jgi:hypothetical protein
MVKVPKVVMVLERQTKGAYRYRGTGEDDPDRPLYVIGTLYLRRAGLAALGIEEAPSAITVEIEVKEAP